ncbi:DUF4190 domain-containing protein [Micromonospora sp. PLK6-60]|uniref:DUF4190 domain-containing protein n=1 Tax=Micromonospora sp. PLK6-60 TaxID=2873383 RepID=UPI001CA70C6B|nr:DUF4190 domain-containing protein [Micromonospora sp. PLK6-60]MBY8871619.1 DUF4190 domain-containing protein [Micromonospora sp. PLK6-60]
MSYPPPSGGWHDPAAPAPQSTPPADPTLPLGGSPVPAQAGPVDPYAGLQAGDPYAAPGYPPPGGAPYGYPPAGYPPPGYRPGPPQNGLAIASMVVSIIGALGLCAYGLGGYVGIVGLALGYVSRRQIRERGEGGEGFATAGIVVGWIATVIAVLATVVIVGLIIFAASQGSSSSTGY